MKRRVKSILEDLFIEIECMDIRLPYLASGYRAFVLAVRGLYILAWHQDGNQL